MFDNPGRLKNTPKYFEHLRRDSTAKAMENHTCKKFTQITKVPTRWREGLLNCRKCKRNLVTYVTHYFLNNIHSFLQPHQTFYTAGGFDGTLTDTTWFVQGDSNCQPDPAYSCNAEETDTRIWLHVRKTTCEQILVLSPDTDVYHIGITMEDVAETKDVVVQTNPMNSRQLKYVHIAALIKAFSNDPDLSHIDSISLPQIFQTLYVCTGCDYTSFFSHVGKATFLRYFFQYASFITGRSAEGTLTDIHLNDNNFEKGFLAFLRLVGTVYFKKHAASFDVDSPASHVEVY